MTGLAVTIWLLSTQTFGSYWWVLGTAIAIDLIATGYKAAKR